jgi:hypothetical protein
LEEKKSLIRILWRRKRGMGWTVPKLMELKFMKPKFMKPKFMKPKFMEVD